MFSSQFDGSTAFTGGGFTGSQSTQATDSGISPARSRDTQGLMPVTVKQISEASQSGDDKSSFRIDGVDITNVTLVGMVFNKVERVTDVAFSLDDGTGRVDCKRWVNEAFDTKEIEGIHEGMYVRVNGHLKSFQGRILLNAFSVRPVTNFDEISCHFVECIHNHLLNSKSQLQVGSTLDSVSSQFNTPVHYRANGNSPAPLSQLYGQINTDGLKALDQMVLDFLQQPSNIGSERGVHRDEIVKGLKIPLEKIMDSIRSLEEEGLIYSTIDEFHYKSTASV